MQVKNDNRLILRHTNCSVGLLAINCHRHKIAVRPKRSISRLLILIMEQHCGSSDKVSTLETRDSGFKSRLLKRSQSLSTNQPTVLAENRPRLKFYKLNRKPFQLSMYNKHKVPKYPMGAQVICTTKTYAHKYIQYYIQIYIFNNTLFLSFFIFKMDFYSFQTNFLSSPDFSFFLIIYMLLKLCSRSQQQYVTLVRERNASFLFNRPQS